MNAKNHTFVIPAYQDSPYLEECIVSLKQQSVISDILITTATPSLFIRQLSQKYEIPLLIHKESQGISSDWTFAYNSAQTEYVTLAHQDDLYRHNYTEKCLSSFNEKSQEGLIVFTDCDELLNGRMNTLSLNRIVKKIMLWPFLLRSGLRSFFLKGLVLSLGNPIVCPSVMYHRKRLGRLEFSSEYAFAPDWEMWLRLSKVEGYFFYQKEKLIIRRLHSGSETSRNIKNRVRSREEKAIFRKIWPGAVAVALALIYSLGESSHRSSLCKTK